MKNIKLLDLIYFNDTDGTPRVGVVHTLPDHVYAHGKYHVAIFGLQGLTAVAPESVISVYKAGHQPEAQ